jgi:predicted transcriptional regulator
MTKTDLRELRVLSGMTQQRLARAIKLDRSFLSMIEAGVLEANDSTTKKIKRVLLRAIVKRRARIDVVLSDADFPAASSGRAAA